MLQGGMFLGASGALAAALAIPAGATSEDLETEQITGVWMSVVSAADKSFPSFAAIEVYGERIWLGSGQGDLTPAALASTLWGVFRRIGRRKYRGSGRFWTYDPAANPTGLAAVDMITTVSEDGKAYHGVGSMQLFDNNGNPLGPATPINDDGVRVSFP